MTLKKMATVVAATAVAAACAVGAAEAVPMECCPDVHLVAAAPGKHPQLWDRKELFAMPEMTPADDLKFDFEYADNVKPIYLEGITYEGKPTRFFAWLGLPKDIPEGQRVPGVVLVHGGGGTAFVQWVEEWTARGYAAIAMDTTGGRPLKRFEGEGVYEHLVGDRNGRQNYEKDPENPHDSWLAHAVGTIVRSHTYLRSLPQVDAKRVGITGISWGGYLTCVTAAVDDRFAAAVPVYGCGFIGEFKGTVTGAPRAWLELFDPCMYLASVKIPILFANRPVDPPYHWEQWVRSSLLPRNAQRSCRLGLGHSHGQGRVPEAVLFLDAYCKGAPKVPLLGEQKVKDGVVTVKFKAYAPVERATIAWTEDTERLSSPERRWKEAPAGILGDTITANVPEKATRYFINLYDIRGGVFSTAGFGYDGK